MTTGAHTACSTAGAGARWESPVASSGSKETPVRTPSGTPNRDTNTHKTSPTTWLDQLGRPTPITLACGEARAETVPRPDETVAEAVFRAVCELGEAAGPSLVRRELGVALGEVRATVVVPRARSVFTAVAAWFDDLERNQRRSEDEFLDALAVFIADAVLEDADVD
jgi:hypothetical protein